MLVDLAWSTRQRPVRLPQPAGSASRSRLNPRRDSFAAAAALAGVVSGAAGALQCGANRSGFVPILRRWALNRNVLIHELTENA